MLHLQDHDGELAWCVVQTVTTKEALCASEIVRAGLSCFWPRYCVDRRSNGYRWRTHPVLRSLFPGYVFAGFPPGTPAWRRVCGLPGEERVLTSANEKPALVPQGFLRSLLGHEAELAHNLRMARVAFAFKPGDTVRVVDGPFRGHFGKLAELDDDGRVAILLDLLGRKVPISGLSADQIRAGS